VDLVVFVTLVKAVGAFMLNSSEFRGLDRRQKEARLVPGL
jgi:hypothetical protein